MKKHQLLAAALLASASTLSNAALYLVTKYADDGTQGTLRWAIEQSNANPNPAGNTIQILTVGAPPYVIKLNSLLPTITGPALVQGMQKGLPTAGPSIAIDGSNFINGDNQSSCPGTVTGVGPNSRVGFRTRIGSGGFRERTNHEPRNSAVLHRHSVTAKPRQPIRSQYHSQHVGSGGNPHHRRRGRCGRGAPRPASVSTT